MLGVPLTSGEANDVPLLLLLSMLLLLLLVLLGGVALEPGVACNRKCGLKDRILKNLNEIYEKVF